jgi:acyl-CoA thioester hydrolase
MFTWHVSFADTDAGGIVYHTKYLEIAERARAAWLRANGLSNKSLLEQNVLFTVTKLECHFRKPAYLDSVLTVTTRITTISGAQIHLEQCLHEAETLLVCINVSLGCITRNGKPQRIPINIKHILLPYP